MPRFPSARDVQIAARVRTLACLVLAGCMTDPTGATCLPAPGGDGYCGGGGGGTSHFQGWGSPSVIALHTGADRAAGTAVDALHVAIGGWQTDGASETDLVTVSGGVAKRTRLELGDDRAGPAQLGFAAGHEVIAWSDVQGGPSYAAPLADPASRVALGDGFIRLHRVGDRFLALHDLQAGTIDGTWLAADGTSAGAFEKTGDPGDAFAVAAGGDVLALAIVHVRDDGSRELRVTRIAPDGSVIAADQLVAASQFLDDARVIVLPDTGVLVLYRAEDGVHAARIAPAGTLTDVATDARPPFRAAVRGDTILALSFDTDASVDVTAAYDVTSRVLDLDGRVVAGPNAIGESSFDLSVAPTAAGYAVGDGTTDDSVSLVTLDASGRTAGAPLSLAASSSGGCNSGGSPGLALALLGLVLGRRRSA